jgi:manganese/iron transport system ATP-binding protein
LTTSASPALEVDGLSVAFGRHPAVEDVHLCLDAGSAMALIGPNGAGKSTLLRAALGLVPLARGTVRVLGQPPQEARPHVAYVPQADTLDAQFPISVDQVVLMGRYRKVGWVRRPGRADRDAARAALVRVGLEDRARVRFGALSGGQRQRVLLARAIVQEPQLLLLDEPFNGLDATTTDVLVRLLAEFREQGAGVLMATHDLAVAHLTCGEACLLNRRQVAVGPIGATLTPELLAAAYGSQVVALAGGVTVVTTT